MRALSDVLYVTQVKDRWEVKSMYSHKSVQFTSREAAERHAIELAQTNAPCEVRIHRADGSFDYARHFP